MRCPQCYSKKIKERDQLNSIWGLGIGGTGGVKAGGAAGFAVGGPVGGIVGVFVGGALGSLAGSAGGLAVDSIKKKYKCKKCNHKFS